MTQRKLPELDPAATPSQPVAEFDPVPRKYRHDGWTPERQRAFIGALADTGSVSRACRHVNMSPEGAYYLRRQPGSEGFRRAWEAALDLGVQRLKDIAYERAIDGQLVPVFVAGQLKGFRRIRNDRLLMFCLRMNARDEQGKRLAASYFNSAAARLHGGPGDFGPSPLAGEMGRGGSLLGGASLTVPNLTRAEKDDANAAIVEHFDPVQMTLAEIEAMQEMLKQAAARHRAEQDGPAEHHTAPAFIMNLSGKWKEMGQLEGLVEGPDADVLEPFNEDEDDWRELGEDD